METSELQLKIRNMSDDMLMSELIEQENMAEEGLSVFDGSFDSEIIYGEDALKEMNHHLYVKEAKSRDL